MKKLFISQPMDDKTDAEILITRAKVIINVQCILEEKVEVIDSFFQGALHDAKPLWFLGKSIQLLSNTDVVYFAKGWENYHGCKIEHECAVQYGIKIIEE